MKKVSKEEFLLFLKNYPNKLNRDVNAIFEPPVIEFNDFFLDAWPCSVVAVINDGEYFIDVKTENT